MEEVLIDLLFRRLDQRYDYICPDEEKAYAPGATSTAIPSTGAESHTRRVDNTPSQLEESSHGFMDVTGECLNHVAFD